jgi:4-alpha-glucanotransferase
MLSTEKLTAQPVLVSQKEPLKNNGHAVISKKKAITAKAIRVETASKNAANGHIEDKLPIAQKPLKKKATKAADTNSAKKTTQKTNKKAILGKKLNLSLQLKYQTSYGQSLFVCGNHTLLGNGDPQKALPMQYLNDGYWQVHIELDKNIDHAPITYNYLLKNLDGSTVMDWGNDHVLSINELEQESLILDSWNHAGYIENAFYTVPFQHVLLHKEAVGIVPTKSDTHTHSFSVKAPLLPKGQTLCIIGSAESLGNWDTAKAVPMYKAAGSTRFTCSVNLSEDAFPVAYKYGIYDLEKKSFIQYEDGNNRMLYTKAQPKEHTWVNDAFAVLPSTTWKGAGIAIPVFSLRSADGLGIGEFNDLKALVDWCKLVGLKLLQILPINDTTATHTWMDSYPYAAISAFALHPIYLNLNQATSAANKHLLKTIIAEQEQLNTLDHIDYEQVMQIKHTYLKKLYDLEGSTVLNTEGYHQFYQQNKHWLLPYAAFCYLRDEYGTAHFDEWPAYRHYVEQDIEELDNTAKQQLGYHYFLQYLLHLQLKEATEYAHANGIVVKGDIPIGIYRYGTDAWQQPGLYHMNVQAGAPPDDFAVKGQNWGFPTYNWQAMKQDGYAWWKQRFEQMGHYFDAFRIDHILGFFRIWSIPTHAVEGIMGYFVPAIPVHVNELHQRGIAFDYHRYTKPFITDAVLWEVFGYDNELVKKEFLNYDGFGSYVLKPAFTTQRQVEKHFAQLENNEQQQKIKNGLYDLISNVLLFEVEGSQAQQFHFRFSMQSTSSYKNLDGDTQSKLNELYINYFFRRQDDFWRKEALEKLPALKRVTNMLICGEDLGLVPECVHDVMQQLGFLSLEIQRMPKDPKKEFFHPNDAPYLSVVTPSTHDMSTIRGWWEEDATRIQHFYNHELGQWGTAPQFCEDWVNKAIVMQHLYSPAMWSIFQLQDLLGIDANIRRENPNDERINIPANPKHYWRYRMHMSLTELMAADNFNGELKKSIIMSGR